MPKDKRSFDLALRLSEFALAVIRIAETLPETVAGKHLATRLLDSGTAHVVTYGEAQGAESRANFIHKMKLTLKDLRESKTWLEMIEMGRLVDASPMIEDALRENDHLIGIFVNSINTAKRNHLDSQDATPRAPERDKTGARRPFEKHGPRT